MKKLRIIIVVLILLMVSNVNALGNDNPPTKKEAVEALKTVAKAYYYRGNSIQYGSFTLTYLIDEGPSIRNFHQIPEMATSQNKLYLDCSSFVYLLFEQTFQNKITKERYKLGGYESREGSSTDRLTQISNPNTTSKYKYIEEVAVYFKRNGGLLSDSEKQKEINIIKDKLQPGDVIVYRTGKKNEKGEFVSDGSGHVLLYLDNDEVVNVSQVVNGYSAINYQFYDNAPSGVMREGKKSTVNPNGAVGYVSLKNNVLMKTSNSINKYIFDNNIFRLSIIRPLNEITKSDSQYVISNDTINRMNYPDLVINKTTSINPHRDVNLGEKITYTIELTNKSNTNNYTNIQVTDIIPKNTMYVSMTGNGTNKSGNLSWNVNVSKGETKKISYTVQVPNDENLLGKYVTSNQTIVNGIKINDITIQINKKFNQDVLDKIVEIVNSKKDSTVSGNIASIVYKELSTKNTFFDNISVDDIFSNLFEISQTTLSNNSYVNNKFGGVGPHKTYKLKEYNSNNKYHNMLVSNMYGGLFVTGKLNSEKQDTRVAKIYNNDLKIGDVLIIFDDDYKKDTYVSGEKNFYLYLGDGDFASTNNNKVVILNEKTKDKLTKYENGTKKSITNTTNRSRILDSLLGQNVYVVLRPSHIADVSNKKDIVDDVKGDVDGDGKVSTIDYILIRKHIIGISVLTGDTLKRADVDENGKVGATDYIAIRKIILGI